MSRTIPACAAMALAMSLAVPAIAQQAQRPQIETRKVDGTEGVYIFRNGNHQAMFIVTRDGVIATDPVAYGRPTGGQQYVDEIKKVTDKPIKYLIYSHHHYDHIAGGKAFKDAGATILAQGGRILARGLPSRTYEAGLPARLVLVRFESLEKAVAAYESPAYQAAVSHLAGAAERDLRIIEAVE